MGEAPGKAPVAVVGADPDRVRAREADVDRVAVVEALVRVEIASVAGAVRQSRISKVFPVLNKSARNVAVR